MNNIMHDLLNPSTLLASATSALGTLGLATHALPVPDGIPSWLPYLSTILGPVLIMLFKRLMAGKAAQDRALAESKEKTAARLRADTNPANDGDADKLEEEAAVLKAKASAYEAARKDG